MLHNTDTIYRKLRMNATVSPPEMLLVLRDFDERLAKIEEKIDEGKSKESNSRRRKSVEVSSEEVPTPDLPEGSD